MTGQRAPREAILTFALLLGGVVAGAYAAELLTRLAWRSADAPASGAAAACEGIPFGARRAQCRYALEQGLPFATRDRLGVFHELEAANPGRSVSPGVAPALGEILESSGGPFLPLAGLSNSLTMFCVEMEGPRAGQFLVFESDERGFRNPAPWDSVTGAVALIGDSFAQGNCVDENFSIAGQLRSEGTRVLNLAVAGVGPLHELAILKEYALQASPSLVVWIYFEGNDLADLEREKGNPFYGRYLSEGAFQGLYTRQSAVDEALRGWIEAASREARSTAPSAAETPSLTGGPLDFLLLSRLRRLVNQRLRRPSEASFPYDSLVFRRTIEEARETLDGIGVPMLFVYLPQYERYGGGGGEPHKDQVIETVRGLGVPVLDIDSVFSRSDPLDAFPNRLLAHYSPEGYRRIAAAIRDWIEGRR